MRILLCLFLSAFVIGTNAQTVIDWSVLADVRYTEKYSEELGSYTNVPQFGAKVSKFANKLVEISGYVIPLDVQNGLYVLSANPYAACFFCGGAGPETVMDLKFTKVPKRFRTDEKIKVRGILKLNASDIYQLNYILDKAVWVKD